jgi:hypothetical protein
MSAPRRHRRRISEKRVTASNLMQAFRGPRLEELTGIAVEFDHLTKAFVTNCARLIVASSVRRSR